MKKTIIFAILMLCIANIFVYAADIDAGKIKTEDLRLGLGQNTSLILNPGSPFSVRLYEGATVEFDVDGTTHKAIFDKIGDESIIRYSIDGGKTLVQEKLKLGDSLRINLTSSSMFVYINYKILHDSNVNSDRNAVFELGTPIIQRYSMPVKQFNESETNTENKSISDIIPETSKKGSDDNYLKYLIGVIIVLVIIIVILGPRKKEQVEQVKESIKDAVEKVKGNGKKPKKVSKTYYKKPNKKKFDEEDVYVVKSSDEE